MNNRELLKHLKRQLLKYGAGITPPGALKLVAQLEKEIDHADKQTQALSDNGTANVSSDRSDRD